jgi:predicted amidophosphoribosyltransferase
MSTLWRNVLSALAPPACFACGASAGNALPLCPLCRDGLSWLPREPVVIEAGEGASITAWAPLAYRGGARALAQALKFRGAVALADDMAAAIVAGVPPELIERTALVPVPLHPSRRRRRGFNQAERLAGAIAARAGAPVADCLSRGGPRGTQMGRDHDERLAALSGTISVRIGARPPPRALLVDDVVTTGATLLACAAALRAAGAEGVAAIAYARTPGR